VKFISGAAVLADGRVGLIVNVEEIASSILDKRHIGRILNAAEATAVADASVSA